LYHQGYDLGGVAIVLTKEHHFDAGRCRFQNQNAMMERVELKRGNL